MIGDYLVFESFDIEFPIAQIIVVQLLEVVFHAWNNYYRFDQI